MRIRCPQNELKLLVAERESWLRAHPEPWTLSTQEEYHTLFTERIEEWLDQGYGSCLLGHPQTGSIAEQALIHFDLTRYALDTYVIMPNHVHALIQPAENQTLPTILHSWKSYSAHAINDALNRNGTVWIDEYFDHAVRSGDQLEHFRRYILENPSKAGLKTGFRAGSGSGIRLNE